MFAPDSRLADIQADGYTYQRIVHNTERQSLYDKNIACEQLWPANKVLILANK